MRFHVILDRHEERGRVAECSAIPGCVSLGANCDEAMGDVREAIAACLEVRAERGCR